MSNLRRMRKNQLRKLKRFSFNLLIAAYVVWTVIRNPDLRFGQILVVLGLGRGDTFYTEPDVLLKEIRSVKWETL